MGRIAVKRFCNVSNGQTVDNGQAYLVGKLRRARSTSRQSKNLAINFGNSQFHKTNGKSFPRIYIRPIGIFFRYENRIKSFDSVLLFALFSGQTDRREFRVCIDNTGNSFVKGILKSDAKKGRNLCVCGSVISCPCSLYCRTMLSSHSRAAIAAGEYPSIGLRAKIVVHQNSEILVEGNLSFFQLQRFHVRASTDAHDDSIYGRKNFPVR
mmetsp:Transcript_17796/g.40844  ORF Transcript_17796/g.40844 Transcript_17796/m.40844 type:complete len:210 (+) Transcript_17796:506-1135(+)